MRNHIVDINQEIENSLLVKSIEQFQANDSLTNEQQVYDALIEANLLLPAVILDTNKINIVKITDRKGNDYIPAFTDWANFIANPHVVSHKAVIFNVTDFLRILHSDATIAAMVINPYTHNMVLTRDNLNAIEYSEKINIDENVFVGIPAKIPEGLIENLIKLFSNKSIDLVKKAFLLQMVRNNTERSLLLVIDTENIRCIPEIAECASKFLNTDIPLDIIPLSDSFGKQATNNYKPFYSQ